MADKTAEFVNMVNQSKDDPTKLNEFVMAQAAAQEPAEPTEPTPPVDPTPPVEPAGPTEPVAPVEPTPPTEPITNPLQSIFGDAYNESITPDVVKDAYTRWSEAQKEAQTLREKLAFYQDVEALIENPYPNERIARLAAAERVLKIDDPAVVGYVSGATESQMLADPVTAVAVQKALANPTLLQKGVTFDDLKAAAQEELGIEEGTDLTPAQRIKVKEAVYDITAKQGELKAAPTDFKQLIDTRRSAVQTDRAGLLQELTPMADTVTAEVINEFKAAGIPVTPDAAKLTDFAKSLIAHYVHGGANKSDITPAMVTSFVRQQAIEQAGGISGIGTSVKSYVDSQVKAALDKERRSLHNGEPVQKPAAPGAASPNKTADFVKQTLADLKPKYQ